MSIEDLPDWGTAEGNQGGVHASAQRRRAKSWFVLAQTIRWQRILLLYFVIHMVNIIHMKWILLIVQTIL